MWPWRARAQGRLYGLGEDETERCEDQERVGYQDYDPSEPIHPDALLRSSARRMLMLRATRMYSWDAASPTSPMLFMDIW